MRNFTILALAGSIGAAICALQLGSFKAILAGTDGWESSWLAQGRTQKWWSFYGSRTSRAQESQWDILYHIGGNGPWIKKTHGTVDEDIEPPAGCEVDQVHMVSRTEVKGTINQDRTNESDLEQVITIAGRCQGMLNDTQHPMLARVGESTLLLRYRRSEVIFKHSTDVPAGMLDLLRRMKDSDRTFNGTLAFTNQWSYFSNDPSTQQGQLTRTGPYAGSLSAFRTGTMLRTRYRHLLPQIPSARKINLWASSTNRVVETARYFATGFFGLDWASDLANLQIISNLSELGADTLTPQNTCLKYRTDLDLGHEYGYTQLKMFSATYLPQITDRLRVDNPDITFTERDIYTMQEMCGFEILARGESSWCDVFTHEDWYNFQYARDVLHYYRAGPGNRYGPAMGWLWLNATANLLEKGPNTGKLFFSFVHDGDIIPMLSAFDIMRSPSHLPTTHRPSTRTWRTSQVVPMSGRTIFERLTCSPIHNTPNDGTTFQPKHHHQLPLQRPNTQNSTYVRININDGIVALPGCSNSGPGSSCPLGEFLAHVRRRGEEAGDFREVCGLGPEVPGGITFLHQ